MRIRERFNPHAPFEARRGGRLAPASNDRFNPRAPCGARPAGIAKGTTEQAFQPTRPLRGATRARHRPDDRAGISTHAPLAGRDVLKLKLWQLQDYFNPRAPCGARLALLSAATSGRKFQPTRPLRGATGVFGNTSNLKTFQPTRPLRGATIPRSQPSSRCRHFNPRAPCGARQRYGVETEE